MEINLTVFDRCDMMLNLINGNSGGRRWDLGLALFRADFVSHWNIIILPDQKN